MDGLKTRDFSITMSVPSCVDLYEDLHYGLGAEDSPDSEFDGVPAPLLQFGEWMVLDDGLENSCRGIDVPARRRSDPGFIGEMASKSFTDLRDFLPAFYALRRILYDPQRPDENGERYASVRVPLYNPVSRRVTDWNPYENLPVVYDRQPPVTAWLDACAFAHLRDYYPEVIAGQEHEDPAATAEAARRESLRREFKNIGRFDDKGHAVDRLARRWRDLTGISYLTAEQRDDLLALLDVWAEKLLGRAMGAAVTRAARQPPQIQFAKVALFARVLYEEIDEPAAGAKYYTRGILAKRFGLAVDLRRVMRLLRAAEVVELDLSYFDRQARRCTSYEDWVGTLEQALRGRAMRSA